MQTKKQSFYECLISTFIGYWVAVAATQLILPWFGIPVAFRQNLWISALFTVVSIIRSYFVRRLFSRLHERNIL